MFYYLLYPLKEYLFVFNVFRYITFRAGGAAITSLLLTMWLTSYLIKYLKGLNIGEKVRNGKHFEGLYQLHKGKEGTPTMGGLAMILSIFLNTLLWTRFFNKLVIIVLVTLVVFSLIGFWDDYVKFKGKSRGISVKKRLCLQIIFTLFLFGLLCIFKETNMIINKITFPFFKIPVTVPWMVYLIFIFLVLSGSSNGVNITDGLDGLAIGCILTTAAGYAILSYLVGHVKFAQYLNLFYVPESGELSIVCAAVIGAGLGFLWYNAPPAQIFMGDIGATTLGALLGVISILIKRELWLLIFGGVFVLEVISVLLQVGSLKLRKKRIFSITPLHHHFELGGLPETKITIRFWIVSVIFLLVGLGTIKLQ